MLATRYNSDFIKTDLEAFAKKVGCKVFELNTGNMLSARIACANDGMVVSGATYLKGAAIHYGLKNKKGGLKRAEALKRLKNQGCVKRDEDYYFNQDYVRADLEAFARMIGVDVLGLGVLNMSSSIIIACANGEHGVRASLYLNEAALCFGVVKNNKGVLKCGEPLRRLKIVAGYISENFKRDKNYYSNQDYVREDLEAFAREAGVDVFDLIDRNMQSVCIDCVNGERVRGKAYLYRAALCLGIAKNKKEANTRHGVPLRALKNLVGYSRDKE